ncbi:hypothetical protein TREES_T100014088 [Tupaia chinensis]|uniref:Uncharacterized protein n=1 Tax=Tupaia chinensis TaxID=246437 RepID=L9KKK8_TUPCH|nr:hypothetical protein TREES_T100014088 [Tupaia chinensis]
MKASGTLGEYKVGGALPAHTPVQCAARNHLVATSCSWYLVTQLKKSLGDIVAVGSPVLSLCLVHRVQAAIRHSAVDAQGGRSESQPFPPAAPTCSLPGPPEEQRAFQAPSCHMGAARPQDPTLLQPWAFWSGVCDPHSAPCVPPSRFEHPSRNNFLTSDTVTVPAANYCLVLGFSDTEGERGGRTRVWPVTGHSQAIMGVQGLSPGELTFGLHVALALALLFVPIRGPSDNLGGYDTAFAAGVRELWLLQAPGALDGTAGGGDARGEFKLEGVHLSVAPVTWCRKRHSFLDLPLAVTLICQPPDISPYF